MVDLIRIDDRLVHGQVMAAWARALGTTRILILDDAAAADPFTRQIMQAAMPAHIRLDVEPVGQSTARLAEAERDRSHTLALLRDVDAAAQLHALHPLRALNVGGAGMAPGRRLVWRSIALSPGELSALRRLRRDGVDVYLQMIPGDPRKPIEDLES